MFLSDTFLAVIKLLLGFVLLFFGGDWLVDGGVAIARKYRISSLVIGMTIVAFGTSAPELLVSMISAIKGSAGIAMGNVLGSNIANIGLILGMTAILCPIPTQNNKVLTNGIIMILASILLLLFSLNGGISRAEGIVLFAGLVLFTVISILKGRTAQDEKDAEIQVKNMSVLVAILLIILSCFMLAFGADFMVDGATVLAKSIGVSDKVIGLTIVALGTSLPELAASIAAAVKKEMDISIGNIIGSNIFNILCVLGVSGSIRPISFQYAQYNSDFIIMLGFSIALVLFVQPWKPQGRLGRLAGIVFLLAYIYYAISLF